MATEIPIKVMVFGNTDEKVLTILKRGLPKRGFTVGDQVQIEIPGSSYNTKRGQYLAHDLLDLVRDQRTHALGVCDVDLFVPELNFVFGLAERPGKAALISVYRLHDSDDALYADRVLKEAVHELGHVMGLSHCPKSKCVMHFSNSLKDTDRKSPDFCKKCRKKI